MIQLNTLLKSNQGSKAKILNQDNAMDANGFVYEILKNSIEKSASDIHIDLTLSKKGQAAFKIRYRVDGHCFDAGLFEDIPLYRGIINKLKLDAGLKIDERRLPQDGRISFRLNETIYNFRLSLMPCTIRNQQEEKVVLRQMADVNTCELDQLGILPIYTKSLTASIQLPHGFICVTGPTGSGKTTLLYALLKEIDRSQKNCITLEDPIEAEIPLVNQSQMFHRIGYDFEKALRVTLRQDPDIIMVGEMRDEETANKAFEAANTGHLVFSTLHTNTAASSITRLLQMKVPHYFISSSLKYVVAQRLIRKLCQNCSTPDPQTEVILNEIKKSFKSSHSKIKTIFQEASKSIEVLKSNETSCENCSRVGYKGRMAIMEVMKIEDEIKRIINFESGNEQAIQKAAINGGMLTIKQYGYLQVLKGLTSFEEVNNVIASH